jgi:5'-deoxynucleotidase YfbR-like HD superfamily hydrolase
MISESEAPMMKQFFWTATAALWLATTPAQAQSTLDKYLAKNSQSTGASANQKSDSGINKVFKSAEGYWRLDDTRANGGSCSVTYVSGAQFAGYVGPTASSPDSVIVFSAPSIPATKSATNKKMKLTTADGKVQTVPAVHAPNVAQKSSGIILFRLTNIQAAMDEISDVENINVVMENKQAFAIKWAGGLAARKAISLLAEKEAKALIAGFINSIPKGKVFISADAVYAKLLSLGFDYVTHYVISLFLENHTKPAYRKLETATQFIEAAMKSLIPADPMQGSRVSYDDVCYEALCVHSKDLLRHRTIDEESDTSKIYWAIFARQPRLVQTVMIASAVIGLFSSVATGGRVLEQQKIDRQTFLQIVFDNDVNSSIKHFMLDPAVERRLLSSAKLLANELDFDSLSFSLYLLGRITSTRNKTSALETLQAVRGILEGDVAPSRRRKRHGDLERRYEQLAFRSLYISLASHGDQHATDTYIAKLIADPVEDELNRGFHLEYYGDRRSDDIGVDLQFSDDHKRWHRTSSYLLEHIRAAAKAMTLTPINQIRLVTYLSFVRVRHEARCLSDEDRLATLELIDTLDECSAKLDGSAPSYIEMVRRNLQFPSFDTLDFIIRLYALKGAQRAGWAARSIMVQDRYVETVASHSFACAVLAEILLDPSDEHWQKYDVAHVRTLALMHDIGEFSIGDYLPAEKTSVNEAREIAYIAAMGSYEKLRDLSYVRDLFNEYEAQSTPESKLARELDKMDALIQAHIYQNYFPDAQDYRSFMLWHYKQIHDSRLRELVERIVP